MKRQEFVDLVNKIAEDEREVSLEKIEQIVHSDELPTKQLINILFKSYLESSYIAARVTGKIIETSGLIQFDDQEHT